MEYFNKTHSNDWSLLGDLNGDQISLIFLDEKELLEVDTFGIIVMQSYKGRENSAQDITFKTTITPEKPTLYKHTMQHLPKHFSVNNYTDIIPKEIRHWLVNLLSAFESTIMAPLNPSHAFH
ncbi:hypothetical protein C1646_677293 [Rhizophagus diaphanus]|nr:hypothetical protein C1646_677293 [Rhizophagus diaphanus] [Rhizophagus sp. MUCL 43196]